MGQIIDEGKFNENTYLIDGMLFRLSGTIAIYVIENGGERMMFDTSEPLSARKIVKKLKEYDLFPIQIYDINKVLRYSKAFINTFSLGSCSRMGKDEKIEW